MADPSTYARQLQEQRALIEAIETDLAADEQAKIEIYKEINEISEKTQILQKKLKRMKNREESLDTLISEISKGFEKIMASTHSLYLLSARQLKMLKRKHPLNP